MGTMRCSRDVVWTGKEDVVRGGGWTEGFNAHNLRSMQHKQRV